VLACLAVPRASAGAVQANTYGVVSAVNGFSLLQGRQSQWGTQMAAMHQNGVQVVRSDAVWGYVQPQPPTASGPGYQWSTYDAWVAALAAHHLTWQPIIDYNTSWTTAVGNNAAFAAFAQAVAARYGAGGTFWGQNPNLPYLPAQMFEIWNEENVSWSYHIDPADYGPLYTAARNAIHVVDPSASVDLGGLADDSAAYEPSKDYPAWYLVQLFGDYPQLERNIDGFALHPYGAAATDSEDWVANFRWALSHYNVPATVPIDLTEFGWPYQASTESWRAAQMSALGDVFSRFNWGIREVAPYDWINPSSVGDADFGFVAPNGMSTKLRPAASAWFNAFAGGSSEPTYTLSQRRVDERGQQPRGVRGVRAGGRRPLRRRRPLLGRGSAPLRAAVPNRRRRSASNRTAR
jgi:hypothetical protein